MLYRNTAGYIDASMVVIATGAPLIAGTVYVYIQRASDDKWLQADLSWNAVKPVAAAIPTMTHVSGGGWKLAHTPADQDDTYFINCIDSGATCYPDNYKERIGLPEAKESTLLALGAQVAALPTVVQISAAVVALGGIGGIITGVVDAGVTVSSSFNPISMEKGEKKVIAYQIKENGVAIDVSAYIFTFGVKRDLYDTTYAFATVAGVISADSDGVLSIVTFSIPAASTKALTVIESGRYSVGMYDGLGNKAALTPPGGVSFRLTEDILDVA